MKSPFALMAVVALTGLAACTRTEPVPEAVRSVRTTTVALGSAGGSHDYAAEIRARVESRLGFRVGGKIVERPVNAGDGVRKGQVLARIDPQDLRLGLDAAAAAAAAAEISAVQAAADLRRFKSLFEQGFISAAELERREATAKAAQAQWNQAKAQSGVQLNQAGYSVLTADAAGVVTAVEAEPGAVVSAGSTVVRLAWDGPRDAVFAVPEDRVQPMRVLLGRSGAVTVRLWGTAGTTAKATVREIAAAADPATRTFLVKADVGNASVRLGQTASVSVDLPVVQAVAKLPLSAVMEHKGGSAVWLLDTSSMTVKVQPIVIAGADANEVVVASGLQAGQVVVTAGVHTLTPGQKVRLYGAPTALPSVR